MKKIINVLIVLFLIGCNNINYKPKYKDFDNARERNNLIGEVKTLKLYKGNIDNDSETSIIQYKKTFSRDGNILYQEHYDSFGNLKQSEKNEYNNAGFRVKSTINYVSMNLKLIELAKFDTSINKQIYALVKSGDSITC